MQASLHIEVRESLAVELGLLLSLASGYLTDALLPDPILEFMNSIGKARLRKIGRYLAPDKSLEHTNMMVLLAFAGDCLVTGDAKEFMGGMRRAESALLLRDLAFPPEDERCRT